MAYAGCLQTNQIQYFMNKAQSFMKSTLFYKKSIREFINGYEDLIMKVGKTFSPGAVRSSKFSMTKNVKKMN